MSQPIDLGDDEGFVAITVCKVEQTLDLWLVNNQLCDLFNKYKDGSATEWHAAVVEYMKEKGYPEVSHRQADRFVDAIFGRVKALKNADGASGTPDSPGSTEPQS